MRILLITPIFQPEPNHLKGLAFARELSRRGYSVQVLTGFPNYPSGSLYPGYRMRWRMVETLDGIEVIRVCHYASHDLSGLRRMLSYLTFALSASIIGLLSAKRPDLIHVYSGPQVTLMIPAALSKLTSKAKIVLDVQDLWPESVESSGMLNVPGVSSLLRALCRMDYALSNRIIVLSHALKELLERRGADPEKIDVVHNWCDETAVGEHLPDQETGVRWGLIGKFNIVFAGTIGKVQALDAVIQAAHSLKDAVPEIQFVLVGGGIEVERLKLRTQELSLSNVRFIPRQPSGEIGKILSCADVLLVHVRNDFLARVGIPQKTQAYLAAGKPILMAAPGEAADIVAAAGAGLTCEPENADSISAGAKQLYFMSASDRKCMGERGRRYYFEHFSFDSGITKINAIYERCIRA